MKRETIDKKFFTGNEENLNDETVYGLEAYAIVSIDKNYGADADGKRGVEKLFVEDIVNVAWFINGNEVNKSKIPENIQSVLEDQSKDNNWEPLIMEE